MTRKSKGVAALKLASRVETLLRSLATERLRVCQPDRVRDLLVSHPDVLNVIPAVVKEASEKLGTDTELSLEAYSEPEIDKEYLTLYVRQKPYTENTLQIIEKISERCAEMLSGTTGWLLVMTDFHAPR